MKVSEATPDQERMDLINGVTRDAAELLGVDPTNDSPQDVMKKVNDAITALVLDEPTPVSGEEDADLLLGCLWGAQMARQFNWYWADVVIDDTHEEVAMISPDKGMIMFPLAFAAACIDKQCICTILLAFNMLLAGNDFQNIEPGDYWNIMLNVHHIVPPYELDEIS